MSERPGRLTRLLPLACLVAALCLLASDLIAMFDLAPPSASTLATQSGGDHHGYAAALVAVFAIAALAVAVLAGSRPAAVAVAVAGVLALAIFVLVDLPDAGEVGALTAHNSTYLEVEATPAGGFYLELISALALTLTGLALALMSAEQLRALRPTGKGSGGEQARRTASGAAKRKVGGSRPIGEASVGRPTRARRAADDPEMRRFAGAAETEVPEKQDRTAVDFVRGPDAK